MVFLLMLLTGTILFHCSLAEEKAGNLGRASWLFFASSLLSVALGLESSAPMYEVLFSKDVAKFTPWVWHVVATTALLFAIKLGWRAHNGEGNRD